MITLSKKAIDDLRIALRKSYGEDFDSDLTDEQINRLGNVVMTIIVEYLKLEIKKEEN